MSQKQFESIYLIWMVADNITICSLFVLETKGFWKAQNAYETSYPKQTPGIDMMYKGSKSELITFSFLI